VKNPAVKYKENRLDSYDYSIENRIKLSPVVSPLETHFGQVILNRRSLRKFQPITLQQISDLLWHTAKVKSLQVQKNGYILTHRGAPSAGARHPIDLLVYNPELLGDDHFYYYNPFDHSLNRLANNHTKTAPLIEHINQIVPIKDGTLIWFIAHAQRTSAKYKNAASLVWRDAGALINSIQLTCSALNINSCPIGSLGEPYISDFFGAKEEIFGTGGLIIG
jgi:SagB-type dehydrogenase family enzyme